MKEMNNSDINNFYLESREFLGNKTGYYASKIESIFYAATVLLCCAPVLLFFGFIIPCF